MNRNQLFEQIRKKGSYLSVGLDPDISKMPAHFRKAEDPLFEFNKAIIDATSDYCVSYKLNAAFYEAYGYKGWRAMEKTLQYIPDDIFAIADAKRGDIGNTATQYARAFFETLDFDAVTIAPYMGEDSITPFLEFQGKWGIILALTSNSGSVDFQTLQLTSRKYVYQEVIEKVRKWGTEENIMFVIGATQSSMMEVIREQIPEHFLLVPGLGAQGGDLRSVSKYGLNRYGGLLVNSSRGIIYASSESDFAERARQEAQKLQESMSQCLDEFL